MPEKPSETSGITKLTITSPYMRGDAVKALQQALNGLGYDAGKDDGICGPDTMSAIEDFCAVQGGEQPDVDNFELPESIVASVKIGTITYTGELVM